MTKAILSEGIWWSIWGLLFEGLWLISWLYKRKSITSAAVLFVLILVGAWARFYEPNTVRVRTVQLPHATTARVALVSDLHLGGYSGVRQVQKWVDAISKTKPDMVLIAGDFVWGMRDEATLTAALAPFSELKMPMLAVLGNHDLPSQGELPEAEMRAALSANGIRVIDDEVTEVNGVQVVGVRDQWNGPYDPAPIDALSDGRLTILLTHNPDRIYDIHRPAAIDLAVAGHTHGGQILLPERLQPFVIPTEKSFTRGLSSANGIMTYVTSGLGTGGLPVRLGVPPEVILLSFGPR